MADMLMATGNKDLREGGRERIMGVSGDHSRIEDDSITCQLEHAWGAEEFHGCLWLGWS